MHKVHKKESDDSIKIKELGVDAIVAYLNHLGVAVTTFTIDHNQLQKTTINSYSDFVRTSHESIATFNCQVNTLDFRKYFTTFAINATYSMTPKINREILLGSFFTGESFPASEPSIFDYEEFVTFDFYLNFIDERDINAFIFKLKAATEPLRERLFNESVDKQITDELSEE